MNMKSKKEKQLNLLEVPDSERGNVLEKLRRILRRSAAETRLWNYLLQCETLIINGQVVFSSDNPLEGLSVQSNLGQI